MRVEADLNYVGKSVNLGHLLSGSFFLYMGDLFMKIQGCSANENVVQVSSGVTRFISPYSKVNPCGVINKQLEG